LSDRLALATGDLDRCADWLEKAIDQRDLWVSFLLNVGNIGGRVMWSSPRWPRLAQLMNRDAGAAHDMSDALARAAYCAYGTRRTSGDGRLNSRGLTGIWTPPECQ
jgi:hypothetical protein